jgi:hypothetical protein
MAEPAGAPAPAPPAAGPASAAAAFLAEALFGRRPAPEAPDIWQDRDVRFDLGAADLAPRRGETVLDCMVSTRRGSQEFAPGMVDCTAGPTAQALTGQRELSSCMDMHGCACCGRKRYVRRERRNGTRQLGTRLTPQRHSPALFAADARSVAAACAPPPCVAAACAVFPAVACAPGRMNRSLWAPPSRRVLDPQADIEDTKGNNGEAGELTVTNLRITWACRRARRTNISIGLDTITQISVKGAASRLRGGLQGAHAGSTAGLGAPRQQR